MDTVHHLSWLQNSIPITPSIHFWYRFKTLSTFTPRICNHRGRNTRSDQQKSNRTHFILGTGVPIANFHDTEKDRRSTSSTYSPTVEPVRNEEVVQNGNTQNLLPTHPTRGFLNQHRLTRRFFARPRAPDISQVPTIRMELTTIPIPCTTIRPITVSAGIHENTKTSYALDQTQRHKNIRLFRRYPYSGQGLPNIRNPRKGSTKQITRSRIPSESVQVISNPNPTLRTLRFYTGHRIHDPQRPQNQDSRRKTGSIQTTPTDNNHSAKLSFVHWESSSLDGGGIPSKTTHERIVEDQESSIGPKETLESEDMVTQMHSGRRTATHKSQRASGDLEDASNFTTKGRSVEGVQRQRYNNRHSTDRRLRTNSLQPSGQPIQTGGGTAGMENYTPIFPEAGTPMGSTSHRLIRGPPEPSSSAVRDMETSPRSMGHRRHVIQLAKSGPTVCLPTLEFTDYDSSEDYQKTYTYHTDHATMANSVMVPSTTFHCPTETIADSKITGSTTIRTRRALANEESALGTYGLGHKIRRLSAQGVEEQVLTIISTANKGADAHKAPIQQRYIQWCHAHSCDTLRPTSIVNFLADGYQSNKLAPTTLANYRSAILDLFDDRQNAATSLPLQYFPSDKRYNNTTRQFPTCKYRPNPATLQESRFKFFIDHS
ncbi:hypothetical protein BGW37DRAFT_541123 [Umbelopsis sp. PMI_123]|nr:hypothetical protein BGW37DRAFT_541123 [Umbelopsis sp. PMI_123]